MKAAPERASSSTRRCPSPAPGCRIKIRLANAVGRRNFSRQSLATAAAGPVGRLETPLPPLRKQRFYIP